MTAKYGVIITERYEVWTNDFDTLREARAYAEHWRKKPKPRAPAANVTVVRIMSEHLEGDML